MIPNIARSVQDVKVARHSPTAAESRLAAEGEFGARFGGAEQVLNKSSYNLQTSHTHKKILKQSLEWFFYCKHLFFCNIKALGVRNIELVWGHLELWPPLDGRHYIGARPVYYNVLMERTTHRKRK